MKLNKLKVNPEKNGGHADVLVGIALTISDEVHTSLGDQAKSSGMFLDPDFDYRI